MPTCRACRKPISDATAWTYRGLGETCARRRGLHPRSRGRRSEAGAGQETLDLEPPIEQETAP